MEVAAGTSDAAVIDVLMAAEMTGEGTSYADLIYSLNLNEAQDLPPEEYGVGFRQGSDLVDAFNTVSYTHLSAILLLNTRERRRRHGFSLW